jgi:hypothetical protein
VGWETGTDPFAACVVCLVEVAAMTMTEGGPICLPACGHVICTGCAAEGMAVLPTTWQCTLCASTSRMPGPALPPHLAALAAAAAEDSQSNNSNKAEDATERAAQCRVHRSVRARAYCHGCTAFLCPACEAAPAHAHHRRAHDTGPAAPRARLVTALTHVAAPAAAAWVERSAEVVAAIDAVRHRAEMSAAAVRHHVGHLHAHLRRRRAQLLLALPEDATSATLEVDRALGDRWQTALSALAVHTLASAPPSR